MVSYEIIESFRHKGRAYARVRYSGIGTTGYRSWGVGAPEQTISESWFRRKKRENKRDSANYYSVGLMEDTYDPDNQSAISWGVEVWTVTPEPTVTETDVWNRLNQLLTLASQQLPFVGGGRSEARIETNSETRREPHDWRGKVRVKGHEYDVHWQNGGPRISGW